MNTWAETEDSNTEAETRQVSQRQVRLATEKEEKKRVSHGKLKNNLTKSE